MKVVIEITEPGLSEAQKRGLVRQYVVDTPAPEHGGFLELTDDISRTLKVEIVGVVDDKYDALLPYIAPPVEAGP